MKNHTALFAVLICGISQFANAQTYQVGDIIEDFELPNRTEGGTSSLYDYEGHIILLEWFAYWCPFCDDAAREIDPGLVQYYEENGGNPHGLPFLRIGMNLQADTSATVAGRTDAFIEQFGIYPTLEDPSPTRLVANRFSPSGGQPIFAVINGVADSPTHQQWEVLSIVNNYGSFSTPIEHFRSLIDGVEPGAATNDTWAGFPLDERGWTTTETPIGFVNATFEPFIFVFGLNSFVFAEDFSFDNAGNWVFLADNGLPAPVNTNPDGPTWAGALVDENGWTTTETPIGFVNNTSAPWLFVLNINSFMFAEGFSFDNAGNWVFIAN